MGTTFLSTSVTPRDRGVYSYYELNIHAKINYKALFEDPENGARPDSIMAFKKDCDAIFCTHLL